MNIKKVFLIVSIVAIFFLLVIFSLNSFYIVKISHKTNAFYNLENGVEFNIQTAK